MFSRTMVWSAIVVYLAVVLGCIFQSNRSAGGDAVAPAGLVPATERAAPLAGLPYRGVALQLQRVDYAEKYKKCLDQIVALGADTVLFVVDNRQENGGSSRIYMDLRSTPTPATLIDIISYAKTRKLRVILMPIVLLDRPRGNEWRGTINPAPDSGGWEAWFDSYRGVMQKYAEIAESTKVDVLVVGSELVSSENKTAEWRETIDYIRKFYKGQLTYSSNWDHYQKIGFWDKLDLIGMNSYWKLGEDSHVTVQEIKANWYAIQRDLLAWVRQSGKPLLFTEVGWCSMANAASEPWDYTRVSEPVDLDLQKRLWEGFFEVWHGNPLLGGFMVWSWNTGGGGPDDKGYSPENKPAENVIRQWFAKPWNGQEALRPQ